MGYTEIQNKVINYSGKTLLVSASAGTGKTTVLIERIAHLVQEGMDISSLAVMTFTNLAAAEMKNRLQERLSQQRNDARIVEQLEKIDNASICTIDSFCNDLLRNYFYVVDIDPSFTILDPVTVASLRRTALDSVFAEYYKSGDEEFIRAYKAFATHRHGENFKNLIYSIFDFGRCLEDFSAWYAEKRDNFVQYSATNPVTTTILSYLRDNLAYLRSVMSRQKEAFEAKECKGCGNMVAGNLRQLELVDCSNLADALNAIVKVKLQKIGKISLTHDGVGSSMDQAADEVNLAVEEFGKIQAKCNGVLHGKSLDEVWADMQQSVALTDKLVEIVCRFEETFFALKKQRGGLDFGDLEQLALKVLQDDEALQQVHEKYKYIFVDEYQDTNSLQEAIISRLAQGGNLFMVGDIKQSIYGFRGCDPTIFLQKYRSYKKTDADAVKELNTNFRSNREILSFVNDIFDSVMTDDFGKVDYLNTAQLDGETAPAWSPAVHLDLVVKRSAEKAEITQIYDITSTGSDTAAATQGQVIAQKISRYVGMLYKDKQGNTKHITYGDIVILMRGLTEKAMDIYNTLVENNIPVMANFRMQGYHNKEIRELINLMRAIDNPYNDIYLVGACLAPFGGFSEDELAQIKIATQEGVPFLTRMQMYLASAQNDSLSVKISTLIAFLDELRFYSRSATVDEVVLRVLEKTNYHLYVQGFPNGGFRLRKMYDFVDGLKGAAYAQSIDKFLAFLDEAEEGETSGASEANAVRLMTMHASKGLEFPIVFVAGLESRFVMDYPAVECNNELGMATRFYDFDNMKVSDTLGFWACGLFNRVKVQEEEMRLLYVALTRAKSILNVVGSVTEEQLDAAPKPMTSANAHLDWILNALKLKYGRVENCHAKVEIITASVGDSTAQTPDLLCQQYTDVAPVMQKLNYQYPFAAQTEMPSKIVSSALDADYIYWEERPDEVTLAQDDRSFVGTAYHRVLQFVQPNATMEQIEQTINSLVLEGKIDPQLLYPQNADGVRAEVVFDALNSTGLRNIMSQGKAYHELPFMLVAPYNTLAAEQRFVDDVMLQGVIDLLVVAEDGRSATVVDFKFSTHNEEYLKRHYRLQLNSYKLAVQKICGITDVKCYILSIETGKLISCADSEPARHE